MWAKLAAPATAATTTAAARAATLIQLIFAAVSARLSSCASASCSFMIIGHRPVAATGSDAPVEVHRGPASGGSHGDASGPLRPCVRTPAPVPAGHDGFLPPPRVHRPPPWLACCWHPTRGRGIFESNQTILIQRDGSERDEGGGWQAHRACPQGRWTQPACSCRRNRHLAGHALEDHLGQ